MADLGNQGFEMATRSQISFQYNGYLPCGLNAKVSPTGPAILSYGGYERNIETLSCLRELRIFSEVEYQFCTKKIWQHNKVAWCRHGRSWELSLMMTPDRGLEEVIPTSHGGHSSLLPVLCYLNVIPFCSLEEYHIWNHVRICVAQILIRWTHEIPTCTKQLMRAKYKGTLASGSSSSSGEERPAVLFFPSSREASSLKKRWEPCADVKHRGMVASSQIGSET